jgi:DNA-binding response OmpR family regulator
VAVAHRALVVEDDPDVRDLIQHVLQAAGLTVSTADTGRDGLRIAREQRPDLVTLDVELPDLTGTEVCRGLREFTDAYVMMVTSRTSEVDRLLALDLGADDYLAKPISPRELTARVAALLRRPRMASGSPGTRPEGEEPDAVVDVGGGLALVPARRVLLLHGEPVPLTPTETDILIALSTERGRVWSREDLVRAVWSGDFMESDFLIDVHVGTLRRKLRRAGAGHDWIRTVEGRAYVFDPSGDADPADQDPAY